ncbi:hypothetical protein [Peristeroidobacter soli]|uniref:hypothetical protein n=1 Tax=Peristeroidobacter soli TaxID=2497877 RepID=UPI00101C7464|nr:hypothetical protein [Peristeroidobacter soli]
MNDTAQVLSELCASLGLTGPGTVSDPIVLPLGLHDAAGRMEIGLREQALCLRAIVDPRPEGMSTAARLCMLDRNLFAACGGMFAADEQGTSFLIHSIPYDAHGDLSEIGEQVTRFRDSARAFFDELFRRSTDAAPSDTLELTIGDTSHAR